jgi:hypothetical protein
MKEDIFIRFLYSLKNGKYKKRLIKNKYEYQMDFLGEYNNIQLYYVAWSKLFNIEGYLLVNNNKFSWLVSYDPDFIVFDNNILCIKNNKLTLKEENELEEVYQSFEYSLPSQDNKNIEKSYLLIKKLYKGKHNDGIKKYSNKITNV